MRAVVISGPGEFRLSQVPVPLPAEGEVLVRVHAAGLNRADLLQSLGLYPPPTTSDTDIPGLEFAGEVEAQGPHSRGGIGARVMGLVRGGAFAEFVTVPDNTLLPIPSHLDWTQAAAIPEAFLTALDGLLVQGRYQPSENILIHAAASGVGTAALQLGRAFKAKSVIASVRTATKASRLFELGATQVLVCPDAKFSERVRSETGGVGADVALDLVGGRYVPETLASLAPKGRSVVLGLLDGNHANLDLRVVLRSRLHIVGSTMRGRDNAERAAVTELASQTLMPLFESRSVAPVVHDALSFDNVQAAVQAMRLGEGVGKWVLRWT